MDTSQTTHQDVARISFELLMVARDVARRSLAEAHVRFGLEEREAKLLAAADIDRLRALANQGRSPFKPLFLSTDLSVAT